MSIYFALSEGQIYIIKHTEKILVICVVAKMTTTSIFYDTTWQEGISRTSQYYYYCFTDVGKRLHIVWIHWFLTSSYIPCLHIVHFYTSFSQ
jgi:hypothetical protein